MKIIQAAVVVQTSKGHFYQRLTLPDFPYMAEITFEGVPSFHAEPVYFPFRIAKLHASELRRAGYNGRVRPYLICCLIAWIKKKQLKSWR